MYNHSPIYHFMLLIFSAFLFCIPPDCAAQSIQVYSNQDQRMEVFVGSAHIYQQGGTAWSDWHWLTSDIVDF